MRFNSALTAATATAGAGVSSIDITTQAGALLHLPRLISNLSTWYRESQPRSFQNRLNHTVSNLMQVAENTQLLGRVLRILTMRLSRQTLPRRKFCNKQVRQCWLRLMPLAKVCCPYSSSELTYSKWWGNPPLLITNVLTGGCYGDRSKLLAMPSAPQVGGNSRWS